MRPTATGRSTCPLSPLSGSRTSSSSSPTPWSTTSTSSSSCRWSPIAPPSSSATPTSACCWPTSGASCSSWRRPTRASSCSSCSRCRSTRGRAWTPSRAAEPVVNAELRDAQDRWPRFAPRAVEAGFRAVHAFPLRLRQEVIGAMNVFGTRRRRWADADVHIVQTLADVATIGLLQERAVRRGGRALRTAAGGAEQPDRHRAGQGRRRAVPRRHRGRGLRDPAHPRPTYAAPTWSRWRQSALTDPAYLAALSDVLPDPARSRSPRPADGSGQTETEAAAKVRRNEDLEALLGRADIRDSAAERRDRAAEEREGPEAEDQSRLDRIWAGRDRDSSMVDRADLMDLLNEEDRTPPVNEEDRRG